jgi:DnaK suppressor protein
MVGTSSPQSFVQPGATMNTPESGLDAAFVETQRQKLLRLRASLVASARATESDEADVKSERADGASELEDDAQVLDALERDGNLFVRSVERLERVDRALKKIEEGTYGLSDISGKAIPRERLQAVPEAVWTLSEEAARETNRTTPP